MKTPMSLTAAFVATATLLACGPGDTDQEDCEAAVAAFELQKGTCNAPTAIADPLVTQAACTAGNGDGFDNTEFYQCLIDNFSNSDATTACEGDGFVYPFASAARNAAPPGCLDLYNSVAF